MSCCNALSFQGAWASREDPPTIHPCSHPFPTHPPCTACHKEAVPHHPPSFLLRNPITFSLRVRRQLMSSWNTVIPSCLTFCQAQEPKANWKDHFYAKGSSKFISRPDLSAVAFPNALPARHHHLRGPAAPVLQPEWLHQSPTRHSHHLPTLPSSSRLLPQKCWPASELSSNDPSSSNFPCHPPQHRSPEFLTPVSTTHLFCCGLVISEYFLCTLPDHEEYNLLLGALIFHSHVVVLKNTQWINEWILHIDSACEQGRSYFAISYSQNNQHQK